MAYLHRFVKGYNQEKNKGEHRIEMLNVKDNPDLVISVDAEDYTIPSTRIRNNLPATCSAMVPVDEMRTNYVPPLLDGREQEYGFSEAYGKLVAKDIFNKMKEAEGERYIDTSAGIKRVKTCANGTQIVNQILNNSFSIRDYFKIKEKILFNLEIMSDRGVQIAITNLYPLSVLDSNAEIENLLVKEFDIVDTRAFKKEFLASLRNLIYQKLNKKDLVEITKLGWEESEKKKLRFVATPQSLNEEVSFLRDHKLPNITILEAPQIRRRLERFLEKNSGMIEEACFVLLFGISSNYYSLVGQRKIHNINLVGDMRDNAKLLTNLVSFFENKESAVLYDIQDIKTDTLGELFDITMDDVLGISISNEKRRKKMIKAIKVSSSISGVALNTPVCFCMEEVSDDSSKKGFFFRTENFQIDREDGVAIKCLKSHLIKFFQNVNCRGEIPKANSFVELFAWARDKGFSIELSEVLDYIIENAEKYLLRIQELMPFPEVQIFEQVLKANISNNRIGVIDPDECSNESVLRENIIRKGNRLFLRKDLFDGLCYSCRFSKKNISNLKKDLKFLSLIYTYDEREYQTDIFISKLGKFSGYSLFTNIIDL